MKTYVTNDKNKINLQIRNRFDDDKNFVVITMLKIITNIVKITMIIE